MANKPVLVKKAPKKPRVSQGEAYRINKKWMGEEPTAKDVEKSLLRSLTWYHSMCEPDDALQFLCDYLSVRNRTDEIKILKRVDSAWIPSTAAWLARIDGEKFSDRIEEFIANALTKAQPEVIKKPRGPVVSIQDRMKEKLNNIIGDLEVLIDQGESFMVVSHIRKNGIQAVYVKQIIDYYIPLQKECYLSVYGEKNRKDIETLAMYNLLVRDLENYYNNIKRVKKARKKKINR